METFTRRVPASQLKKIGVRTSPRLDARARGIFGAELPDMAAHERARKAAMKPPVGVRGRNTVTRITKETKVPISARLREFPAQSLTDSCNKLFCKACSRALPNIKTSILEHIGRASHKTKLAKLLARGTDDTVLIGELGEHCAANPDLKGASTEMAIHLARFWVVEMYLYAGIALNKIDGLRPLLERSSGPSGTALALTAAANLGTTYISLIEVQELKRLIEEAKGEHLNISFDGTTRLGEAINTTARWCSDEFWIVRRLVMFATTARHVDARDLAALITEKLCSQLALNPKQVVGITHHSRQRIG
jgi:hypothetical protein